jgi:anti-anti-sigma factor
MFEYTLSDEASCKHFLASGRIDALSAAEIQAVFNSLILEGTRILLVNLSGVNYVSSAGLRIFISAHKQMKKVGGEILLTGLTPQVLDIFKISGLDKLFRMVSGPEHVTALSGNNRAVSCRRLAASGITLDYEETGATPGRLSLIGDTAKLDQAAYTAGDVVEVPSGDFRFGCGLAALGESFEDCSSLFGEAMIIDHNFFYYPAVRHPSVDFLLDASRGTSAYQFLHGFGFSGDYRYLLSFQAENGAVDLQTLISHFLTLAQWDFIGVVLLTESRGLWGMNIKKPPVAGALQTGGKSIFADRRFPEWFDFPVEPSNTGALVAACGIAAHDPHRLPEPLRNLFSGETLFHLHGGIFDNAPIKNMPKDFESELTRVFNELNVYKIQHLLGRSRFAGGLAGLVPLEL